MPGHGVLRGGLAGAVLTSSRLLFLNHLQWPRCKGGDGVQRQDQEGAA